MNFSNLSVYNWIYKKNSRLKLATFENKFKAIKSQCPYTCSCPAFAPFHPSYPSFDKIKKYHHLSQPTLFIHIIKKRKKKEEKRKGKLFLKKFKGYIEVMYFHFFLYFLFTLRFSHLNSNRHDTGSFFRVIPILY
jgi:hypothetical protein